MPVSPKRKKKERKEKKEEKSPRVFLLVLFCLIDTHMFNFCRYLKLFSKVVVPTYIPSSSERESHFPVTSSKLQFVSACS
jgi:hypothetical protein